MKYAAIKSKVIDFDISRGNAYEEVEFKLVSESDLAE